MELSCYLLKITPIAAHVLNVLVASDWLVMLSAENMIETFHEPTLFHHQKKAAVYGWSWFAIY